jgi:hypothetical protein
VRRLSMTSRATSGHAPPCRVNSVLPLCSGVVLQGPFGAAICFLSC